MIPGPEVLLVLAAIGLYLQDSLLLLQVNEAMMVRRSRGPWRAAFGSRRWRLSGREPFLPNPFAPHAQSYRLLWRMDGAPGGEPASTVEFDAAIARLTPFVWTSWIALFVLLPLGLFTRGGPVVSIAAIAILYTCNAAALWLVHRQRSALGLDGKPLGLLTFECIACPPYAVNLVRRVCRTRDVSEDFTRAAKRLLSGDALATAKSECLARIDEEIELETEGSEREVRLRESRMRFVEGAQA